MKKTFLNLSSLAFGIFLIAGTISSCSKTNPNAQFLGTYTGNYTTGAGTSPDTVVISAGSSSTAVVLLEKKNAITLNGTVSSNTITIPSQNITIAGGSYPTSGTGALSTNTLSVNLTTVVSGASLTSNFTGTKQ